MIMCKTSDMEIKHDTKRLPGIVRNEIYESKDLKYVETFDDITGKRMYGEVYEGEERICSVHHTGVIALRIQMEERQSCV